MLKSYCPVSLLPICEKLIFNALNSFFEDHKLLNPCQPGFKENDPCIYQLESTLNNLLKSPQIHCYFKVIVQVAGGPSVVIILANILGSFSSISSRPQYNSENIILEKSSLSRASN